MTARQPVPYLSDGFTPERTPCRIAHTHRTVSPDGSAAAQPDPLYCTDAYAYQVWCRECGRSALDVNLWHRTDGTCGNGWKDTGHPGYLCAECGERPSHPIHDDTPGDRDLFRSMEPHRYR